MLKRSYKSLKKEILTVLKDSEALTYAQLERKVKTNPDTIRMHCQELELFSALSITKKAKHKLNGRPYFLIKITSQGRKILKKF